MLAAVEGSPQQLADRLFGEGFGVAGAGERFGQPIPVPHVAIVVAHHHALVKGVEGLLQAVGGRERLLGPGGGAVGGPFQQAEDRLDALPVDQGPSLVGQAHGQGGQAPAQAPPPGGNPSQYRHEDNAGHDGDDDPLHGSQPPSAM